MAYTLEDANRLREIMRAAPDKAPNQRRMDKQAIVKEVMDDIAAIQERGYTLEEIAEMWGKKGGVEVTLPTLKSYLQRARKTSGKGAPKAPRRSSSSTHLKEAAAKMAKSERAAPQAPKGPAAASSEGAPKSTHSEFITTDRVRL
jgi:hypothetical protein